MTTKDKQKEEEFMDGILGMAKALSELQDRAVEAYQHIFIHIRKLWLFIFWNIASATIERA